MSQLFKNKFFLAFLLIVICAGILSITNKLKAPVQETLVGSQDTEQTNDPQPTTSRASDVATTQILSQITEKGIIAPIHGDGEISSYRLEIGRSEQDIESKRIYDFSNPRGVIFELQGIDAHSSQLIATLDTEEIFSATIYDHTNVAIFAADPLNFIQTNGHTVMIHTGGIETPQVQMFRDTLKISLPQKGQ